MIRFTALAAALISASLAAPAQAGWPSSNGLKDSNGISVNGLKDQNGISVNGHTGTNGLSLHGAAAATATLLQGITLPNGVTIAH